MDQLLFATHNPWKAQQFLPVFDAYGFRMLTLREVHPLAVESCEDAPTPVANALAKARSYHSQTYPWVFADDAGLEIDALNGEPGLQARRWGGHFPNTVDDQTWLDYLLDRMLHLPPSQRSARFVSGWALLTPDGLEHTHSMYWPFEIATSPLRPMHPGSPISAVRIGPEDDLARRQVEIAAEWQRWGVFELLQRPRRVENTVNL